MHCSKSGPLISAVGQSLQMDPAVPRAECPLHVDSVRTLAPQRINARCQKPICRPLAEAMGHLVRHPGGVVGNHEPAVAALLVNLGLDDGKAESLTALVFAFDARDTGRRRRSLIDVDLRRLFRR